ncbi:thermonuclease family protein [Phyllobacterium sp. SYP-B3895]|uniref:thermonuclease family protein n=1 Tax=Phyllobacterium sp. SYP-B3895 TaxID=2663240 RepID=UPI001AEF6B58|nr:thermonuclease family protein [Phyllobacterium sp. SYP-B3895]
MSDRPRLVVENQVKKKRPSPWQSKESPWIDKLQRERPRTRWRQRVKFTFASLVMGATVLAGVFASRFDMSSSGERPLSLVNPFVAKTALYVVDGDTIHYNGEKIRIANIDTPEISGAKCDTELKRGLNAKAALKLLLEGETLEVRRGDPTTGRTIDKYGRTLALVSIRGRDVGTILIQQRHARPWVGRRMPWC